MPSGKVHNIINMSVYAALGAGAVWAERSGQLSIGTAAAATFTAAFLAGTFLLSPDLDMADHRQKVNSKRNWGPLGALWVPYGLVFSHRGLSHTWILGPLTRLAYLALLVGLGLGLVMTLRPELQLHDLPGPLRTADVWPPAAGYFLSQWLHLIADGIRPDHALRRARRQRRRTS